MINQKTYGKLKSLKSLFRCLSLKQNIYVATECKRQHDNTSDPLFFHNETKDSS